MNGEYLRDYELSIWTLQDRFINVLKWSGMEYRDSNDEFLFKYPGIGQKGQIQNGNLKIANDGTEELNFSVPKFYLNGNVKIFNPLWQYFEDNNFTSNMYKVKIIFNKGTDDEKVYEFVLDSITQTHELDEVIYDIHGTGLAFEELGKIGYKIALSIEDFEEDYKYWFKYELSNQETEMPIANIQYWNDKIFKHADGTWKYQWRYEVNMDWSSFNDYLIYPRNQQEGQDTITRGRKKDKIYEESYISSWNDVNSEIIALLSPKAREDYREKARQVDLKESNIYNLTQTIAETFGVYCKYEYEYDANYHIIGKKVIYYNNYLEDKGQIIDLTYPYTAASTTRFIDSKDIVTKLFVRPIDSKEAADNVITIMNVDANKSREDYLLNFDYLHNIKTITDEQYEAVNDYEVKMHNFNVWLMDYEFRINQLLSEANILKAKVTYYTNAISLDKERISQAQAFRDELISNDNVGYIERGEDNPISLIISEVEDDNSISYQSKISLQGIIPTSVELYQTHNYAKKVNEGRLSVQVKSFEFDYDDFGSINKVKNIVFADGTIPPKMIYMTCHYSPQTYWDNVAQVWISRLEQDEKNLQITEDALSECYVQLYGADVEFALTDYARVEYACAGFSRAGEDIIGMPGMSFRPEGSTDYQNNLIANNGYARTDLVETDDAHAYVYQHEILLDKKNKAIVAFERMMGPALREGYWQPDNYNDYGNQFYDKFEFNWQTPIQTTYQGSNNKSLISLIWDENRFEGENGITYVIGTDTRREPYLIVDLRNKLDKITANLDNLSFIYYDKEIVNQIDDLTDRYTKPIEQNGLGLTVDSQVYKDQVEYLKRKAMRSFSINSKCEFGFVRLEQRTGYPEVAPVLIITGSDTLTKEQMAFMIDDATPQQYKPFIGQVTTSVVVGSLTMLQAREQLQLLENQINTITANENTIKILMSEQGYTWNEDKSRFEANTNTINTTVRTILPTISFFNAFTYDMRTKIYTIYLKTIKSEYINNGLVYYDGRIFPRIFINSLEMKTDSNNCLLNINGTNLNMNEDYYILVRSIQDASETDGYYLTIKPAAIFQFGMNPLNINLSYCVSNADIAVYLDALKVMKENSNPKVSYEVKLNLLNERLIQTAYNQLNHIVHINDIEMGFKNVQGYISSITLDLDNAQNDEFEIKNYETKFEDLFSTIVAQTESMKKNENAIATAANAFTQGLIKTDILQDSLFLGSQELWQRYNNGKLTIDNDGVQGISDEGIVAFRGGGIFTATETDSAGNWIWNTGILPSGINASMITSGQLNTNLIKVYAGNDLAFQLNADGLFAYKTSKSERAVSAGDIDDDDSIITSEQAAVTSNYIINSPDLDEKQYVTFNSQGLFLVLKTGASILNDARTDIIQTTEDINRVEISWKGLILRNLQNERVFYADSDGNLTISGRIMSTSGEIGGWTINESSLNNGNIFLISKNDSNNRNGIYLTEDLDDLGEVGVDNGSTYYLYDNNTNLNDTDIYYSKQEQNDVFTWNNGIPVLYKYMQQPESVEPKYLIITSDKTYIGSSETERLKDKSGNDIEYNQNKSLTASWYIKIKEAYNNYTIYVEYNMVSVLTQLTTENFTSGQVTFKRRGFKPTFYVKANTGEVMINKGTIGNFTVSNSSLSNGKLYNTAINRDSYVTSGNSTFSLDAYRNCFINVTGDSSSGVLHFQRVGGGQVNFNIASMRAYQLAREEAGTLTLINSSVNTTAKKCTAMVQSGFGTTLPINIDAGSIYDAGKDDYEPTKVAWSSSTNTYMSLQDAANTSVRVSYRVGDKDIGLISSTIWRSGWNRCVAQGQNDKHTVQLLGSSFTVRPCLVGTAITYNGYTYYRAQSTQTVYNPGSTITYYDLPNFR